MSDGDASDEVNEVLKALRIHQVELESQNAELRRLQQELGRSHARYLDLYENAPVGYLTLSSDGKITECNLTGALLLKVDKAELQGQPLTAFIHVEDQDAYYLWRQRRFPLDRPPVLELRLRRGPEFFWTRLEVGTTKTEEGAPSWRVAISDVDGLKSAQRAVATSELRYRALFDGALEALFTLAPPQWRVSSANEAAEALFPGATMIGRGLWETSPPLQKEGLRSGRPFRLRSAPRSRLAPPSLSGSTSGRAGRAFRPPSGWRISRSKASRSSWPASAMRPRPGAPSRRRLAWTGGPTSASWLRASRTSSTTRWRCSTSTWRSSSTGSRP